MFGGAGKLVCARELAEVAAGAANNSQNFSVERNFEDSSRESSLSDEKNLVGAGRDADRVGSATHFGEALARRRVAAHGVGSGNRRHVDGEHAQKLSIGVEHLNAAVAAIADVEIVIAVRDDRMRKAKLSRRSSLFAP